ncbi:hypothetical protein [Brachybacterium sp. SGAir0954]|uniref:hypothetical protein n=1 Tax=Brachybacterium sp. SGAir0954 TaxID=2571029 RepID=UPI00197AEFAA
MGSSLAIAGMMFGLILHFQYANGWSPLVAGLANLPMIAAAMVVLTLGMRTVMIICAVALVEAMPQNRTSLGAALNDTAQELGTSIGTALAGTLIAVLVASVLPAGTWDTALVTLFHHGVALTDGALAVVVGLLAGWGALPLTDSRTAEAH